MCQVVGGWVFYGMRTTTVPLQLAGIGYAVGLIGLLLSAGAVAQLIGSGAAGVLSDHSGRVRPLVAALALAAAGLALLGATGDVTVVLVAFVLLGLAGGAVASVGTALLGDSRFGRSGRASASSGSPATSRRSSGRSSAVSSRNTRASAPRTRSPSRSSCLPLPSSRAPDAPTGGVEGEEGSSRERRGDRSSAEVRNPARSTARTT